MAGEYLVVGNPRRKGRKRTNRRHRRARARHSNPVRRRRRNGRRRRYAVNRRRHHRVHRNPRSFYGINIADAAITAGGVIGSDLAAGWLTKMLPSNIQSPIARLGVKAAIGVGAPLVLKRFIGSKTAHLLAAGAAIGVLLDAYHLWIAPSLGLSDYEVGMTGYEANPGLSDGPSQPLGIGENIYADSVY